jgi:hypothetical protein
MDVKFQSENIEIHKYLRNIEAGLTSIHDVFHQAWRAEQRESFQFESSQSSQL